jgi:hypothetical protein
MNRIEKDKIIIFIEFCSMNQKKGDFNLIIILFFITIILSCSFIYIYIYTKYVTSSNEHNVLDKNKKKLVTYYLKFFVFFLYLDKSYICSSRNDQMSMPYKHQLLIEERENVITIIPWSSLCILLYVKCMNTRSFFKK